MDFGDCVRRTGAMRCAILHHCADAREAHVPPGNELIKEGETTGRLYVLVDGKLDVVRYDTLVATLKEPGAIVGKMPALLSRPTRRPFAPPNKLGSTNLTTRLHS